MRSYKRIFCEKCQKGRRFMLVKDGTYECPICGLRVSAEHKVFKTITAEEFLEDLKRW